MVLVVLSLLMDFLYFVFPWLFNVKEGVLLEAKLKLYVFICDCLLLFTIRQDLVQDTEKNKRLLAYDQIKPRIKFLLNLNKIRWFWLTLLFISFLGSKTVKLKTLTQGFYHHDQAFCRRKERLERKLSHLFSLVWSFLSKKHQYYRRYSWLLGVQVA